MRNSKKQAYKEIFFLGSFVTPNLIELMSTEDGRESLYRLLKLYRDEQVLGGRIRSNNEEYEIVIG